MAGLQAGDIINFGRVAWEVYQLGWTDDHNATRNYVEFGRDVKSLAENLDILSRVVHQASSELRSQVSRNAAVRWDPVSLREIIGDYDVTLRECVELLRKNRRYRAGSGPLRNIEWNVVVQPSVDRLRERILLHNSKVLHVLKPFEIDLLSRVRQDIYRVHQDLAQRITAVHHDVHRLMGVLIPDLGQALDQQAQRQVCSLDVPIEIAERFRMAALTDRPEYESDDAFEIQDLSDAFILNYDRSTKNFNAGLLVADRIPPVDQYLNLLKCVWLYKRIANSPVVLAASDDSHWPSYARQLEDDLSTECSRYGQDLYQPEIIPTTASRDMFSVWPEREPTQLVDVVTRDELMEQILEVPLQSPGPRVESSAKLLRRMGSEGRRFRVTIKGSEQTSTGRPREHQETIDFDVTSALINPQYALPSTGGMTQEIILQRDERIARLAFTSMPHVLKFQQAVTGYKAWVSYVQYNAMVSFVVSGLKEPVVEQACIQLWIPKPMDGSLVKNNEESSGSSASGPSSSRSRSATAMTSGSVTMTIPSRTRDNTVSSIPIGRQMSHQSPISPQSPARSPTAFSTSWPRTASPPLMGSSPPNRPGAFSISANSLPSPPRQPTLSTSPRQTVGGWTPATRTQTNGRISERSPSISSAVSNVSHNNSSSGSQGHTIVVPTGTHTTGFLHRRPPKPLLVMFTESPRDGKLSMVTIEIDEDTGINPERCNCRRAGRDGSSCTIAAIEKSKGDANLAGKRYETSSLGGSGKAWNLARLALNNPAPSDDASTWARLRRVSIMFPHANDRIKFGGTPNQCRCDVKFEGDLKKCLRDGHRGLWGEVQEHYRQELNQYHSTRYLRPQEVVYGLMD